MDPRQVEEFYLTAAQTVLGFAVLANMRFSLPEALALLSLFVPGREMRLVFSAAYLLIAVVLLVRSRRFLSAVANRRRQLASGAPVVVKPYD